MGDECLIRGIYKRDEKTYEILMEKYNKFLWVIVGGILNSVGSIEDIEECISDVYIKLWEKPKAYSSEKGTLKTFLAIIAKNKALDKYRQLSKNNVLELKDELELSNDDLLEYIINKEKCRELYEAIGSLNEPDKEIMIRRYFFDEKPKYIASKIALPIKEVENRLYQSKVKIKKVLLIEGGEL